MLFQNCSQILTSALPPKCQAQISLNNGCNRFTNIWNLAVLLDELIQSSLEKFHASPATQIERSGPRCTVVTLVIFAGASKAGQGRLCQSFICRCCSRQRCGHQAGGPSCTYPGGSPHFSRALCAGCWSGRFQAQQVGSWRTVNAPNSRSLQTDPVVVSQQARS